MGRWADGPKGPKKGGRSLLAKFPSIHRLESPLSAPYTSAPYTIHLPAALDSRPSPEHLNLIKYDYISNAKADPRPFGYGYGGRARLKPRRAVARQNHLPTNFFLPAHHSLHVPIILTFTSPPHLLHHCRTSIVAGLRWGDTASSHATSPSQRIHRPNKTKQKKRGETHYGRSRLPSSDPAFGAARLLPTTRPSQISHRLLHGSPHTCVRQTPLTRFLVLHPVRRTSAHQRRRSRARCSEIITALERPLHADIARPLPPPPRVRSSRCLSFPRSFGPRIEMVPTPSPRNTHTRTGWPHRHRRNRNGKTHGCEKRWSRRKFRNCCGDAFTR